MLINFSSKIAAFAILMASSSHAFGATVFTDWLNTDATTASGTLNGIGITATVVDDPFISGANIQSFNLSGSDFSFAPSSGNEEILGYGSYTDIRFDFSNPVEDLLLYGVFCGNCGGFIIGNKTYNFDAAFSVASGFSSSFVSGGGTNLTVPTSSFGFGILAFSGPVSSLTLRANDVAGSANGLTFGLKDPEIVSPVPLPASALLLFSGFAFLMGYRRSRTA